MGFIQFASQDHADTVADALGFDRPVLDTADRIGEGSDDRFRTALGMAYGIAQLTQDTPPTMSDIVGLI